MARNLSEIKLEIGRKNLILSSISRQGNSENEKIRRLEAELDGLLYQYYKQLKCS